ncbi:MAG: ribonuclease [Ruminococcus sp.]|nr:ribonuclease [Ruminococcus sp.]
MSEESFDEPDDEELTEAETDAEESTDVESNLSEDEQDAASVNDESSEEESVPEDEPETEADEEYSEDEAETIDVDGTYTTKEDVALYIHTYGELPSNFMTKQQAQELGWQGGSLEPYAPGMCIGGNRFGNYEGILPEKNGRKYTECDIDTLGASSRGAKRIVFSNDGLIYYTDDHYESFELLYGEE